MFRPSRDLQAMMQATRRAGVGLMRRFHHLGTLKVELKGPANFVSAADRESEDLLRSTLLRRYPRHGFLTEESAPTVGADAGTRFIVDPLDGTTNFLHGVPHFAIAVALQHEGQVVAGVVYDVPKDEMFVAEKGRGAFLNGHRLHVVPDRDLTRAVVAIGIPHSSSRARHARYLAVLSDVMHDAAGIRRMGAAALDLCYVAAGRFALFFELGLAPWDLAAGSILVREAGGTVTEPDGGSAFLESGDVLATNGRLHASTQGLLRRALRRAASGKPRRRTSPRG
jgi:myo-inositol-1(or 4)-monophosphatase